MQWISVTLSSDRAALIDFSKVLYVTKSGTGCRLHFDHGSVDPKGKPVPLGLTIKDPIENLTKSLQKRRLF
jgi:hypothetical protein